MAAGSGTQRHAAVRQRAELPSCIQAGRQGPGPHHTHNTHTRTHTLSHTHTTRPPPPPSPRSLDSSTPMQLAWSGRWNTHLGGGRGWWVGGGRDGVTGGRVKGQGGGGSRAGLGLGQEGARSANRRGPGLWCARVCVCLGPRRVVWGGRAPWRGVLPAHAAHPETLHYKKCKKGTCLYAASSAPMCTLTTCCSSYLLRRRSLRLLVSTMAAAGAGRVCVCVCVCVRVCEGVGWRKQAGAGEGAGGGARQGGGAQAGRLRHAPCKAKHGTNGAGRDTRRDQRTSTHQRPRPPPHPIPQPLSLHLTSAHAEDSVGDQHGALVAAVPAVHHGGTHLCGGAGRGMQLGGVAAPPRPTHPQLTILTHVFPPHPHPQHPRCSPSPVLGYALCGDHQCIPAPPTLLHRRGGSGRVGGGERHTHTHTHTHIYTLARKHTKREGRKKEGPPAASWRRDRSRSCPRSSPCRLQGGGGEAGRGGG